jgi:hypothetical protein
MQGLLLIGPRVYTVLRRRREAVRDLARVHRRGEWRDAASNGAQNGARDGASRCDTAAASARRAADFIGLNEEDLG